ncbi:MAG: protein translocase subunit SecD [Pyrinomonadaceae bacterium]|nr:protein translocase subunit SecD [Pyrinomonadaceae bacterium]MDQ3585023.1 protein translocase subunit SecD [Acidobacteriota bacterium]
MKKNLLTRVIIIVVVTVVALYAVLGPRRTPTAADFTWNGIKRTLAENIRLGLDLRGGSQLVMQVQMPDYLRRRTENVAIGLRRAAEEAGYNVTAVQPEVSGNDYRVILEAADASKIDEIREGLPNKTNDLDPSIWNSSVNGNRIVWEMSATAKRALGQQAVEQSMNIIDSRINTVGVAEPTLQEHGAQGSHQILLQMPGIDDPERIKKLISAESRLELMKVISAPNPAPITTYATQEEAMASLGGQVPPNRRVLRYSESDEPTAAGETPDPNRPVRWVVVETPAVVDGSELRSADAVSRTGNENDYFITFSLKPTGAQKFGAWTAANIGQYMAVVLNDEVKSAPFIKSQITDSGEISGSFTQQSAQDLSLTLRSGALPATLKFIEERTVGPSLGADSIRAGVTASVAGLVLVIVFMVFYYRGAGLNAVIALLLNMIITIAALVFFDATLTLPGIAGLILTIGMTVDTNVLIFERIREELETGKTVASAVEQGFARAFVTVIDTHVTTIVSSLFLFIFGTGPIRGFAVTLVLGLLANLFSAVYVSRTIFIWLLNRKGRRVETLSI